MRLALLCVWFGLMPAPARADGLGAGDTHEQTEWSSAASRLQSADFRPENRRFGVTAADHQLTAHRFAQVRPKLVAFSDDDASNLTARAAERVDLTAPGSISVFVLGAVAIMLVLVVLSMGESAPGAEGRVRALIRGDRLDDLYVRARLKALGAPGVEDEAYLRSLNHRKADLLTTRPFAEGALVAFSAKVGRSFPPTNFHARVQSCEPLPGDEPWHLLKLRIEHDAADSAQVDELLHELAHACSNRNSSY